MARNSARWAIGTTLLLATIVFRVTAGSAAHPPLQVVDGTPTSSACLQAAPDATPASSGTPAAGNAAEYPFDLVFVDAMLANHETSVAMAKIARMSSERSEIITLADAIITVQMPDLAQLRAWRSAWYPSAAPVPANVLAGLLDQGSMTAGGLSGSGESSIAEDADLALARLCSPDGPFDRALLIEIIPLHQRAIGMARVALDRAEHAELHVLADEIVTTEERELAQMTTWLADWYPADVGAGGDASTPPDGTPPV